MAILLFKGKGFKILLIISENVLLQKWGSNNSPEYFGGLATTQGELEPHSVVAKVKNVIFILIIYRNVVKTKIGYGENQGLLS